MAWDWPMAYARTPMLHESDPVGEERKEFEAAVASIVKDHPEIAITTVFTHGHPAQILVEASKGANLLVVGSRGHGAFVGMVLGSVSQHCAAHAHCPVLIHRTPD
jgi:nucleotide-binding universal stress UspA family protein